MPRSNPADVRVLNMRPPEIAAAWERGDVDATFVWDPVLARVKGSGKVMITSGEISKATGKATFDGITSTASGQSSNADFLTKYSRHRRVRRGLSPNTAKWTPDSPGPGGREGQRRQAEGRAGRPGAVSVRAPGGPGDQHGSGGAKERAAQSLAATRHS